jgi:hypothetical protein
MSSASTSSPEEEDASNSTSQIVVDKVESESTPMSENEHVDNSTVDAMINNESVAEEKQVHIEDTDSSKVHTPPDTSSETSSQDESASEQQLDSNVIETHQPPSEETADKNTNASSTEKKSEEQEPVVTETVNNHEADEASPLEPISTEESPVNKIIDIAQPLNNEDIEKIDTPSTDVIQNTVTEDTVEDTSEVHSEPDNANTESPSDIDFQPVVPLEPENIETSDSNQETSQMEPESVQTSEDSSKQEVTTLPIEETISEDGTVANSNEQTGFEHVVSESQINENTNNSNELPDASEVEKQELVTENNTSDNAEYEINNGIIEKKVPFKAKKKPRKPIAKKEVVEINVPEEMKEKKVVTKTIQRQPKVKKETEAVEKPIEPESIAVEEVDPLLEKKRKIEEMRERRKRYLAKQEKKKMKFLEAEQEMVDLHKRRLEYGVKDRLAEMERRKQERLQQLQERKYQEKQIKEYQQQLHGHGKPLYILMEEKYQESVVVPELEKFQQALKKIKDVHKPLEMDELKVFQIEYDQRVKKIKEEQSKSAAPLTHEPQNFYHGKGREILLKEEKERKEREMEEQRAKQDLRVARKKYANEIRAKFAPKVDEKLKQEIEMRIFREKSPERRRQRIQQLLPDINKRSSWHGIPEQIKKEAKLDRSKSEEKRRKVKTKSLDIPQSSPAYLDPHGEVADRDYLRRMGNKYLNENKKNASKKPAQDIEALKDEALALERKTKKKEKLFAREAFNSDDLDRQLAISDVYYNSVQAKIRLLQEIS